MYDTFGYHYFIAQVKVWFQNRRMKHKRQTISKTDDEDNKDSLKGDDDSQPCSKSEIRNTHTKYSKQILTLAKLLQPSFRRTPARKNRARVVNCLRTIYPIQRPIRAVTTTIRPARKTTTIIIVWAAATLLQGIVSIHLFIDDFVTISNGPSLQFIVRSFV